MSHYAALVIGDNIDAQLRPFHEYECTGYNDDYVLCMRVEDDELGDWKDRAEDGGCDVIEAIELKEGQPAPGNGLATITKEIGGVEFTYPAMEFVDFEYQDRKYRVHFERESEKQKWGFCVSFNGVIIAAFDRTNPNKKWDWYVPGGRWSGFLLDKAGNKVHETTAGEIDWDSMRATVEDEAGKEWDKYRNGGELPGDWIAWEEIFEMDGLSIDEKRDKYHAQPALDAVKKNQGDDFNPFMNWDSLRVDREDFVKSHGDRAGVLYAIVADGQWAAKGEMGWFGMSTDEVEEGTWNQKYKDFMSKLPPEVPVTVVDLHI